MPDPTGTINILEWLKLGVEFAGVLVMLWTIVIRMPQMQKAWDAERAAWQADREALVLRFTLALEAATLKLERTTATEADRHNIENQEFRADSRVLAEKFQLLADRIERKTKG